MDSNESLRASDYSSGFMSNIFTNRRVPDLCGLVGMRPKAIYIMLPVEPGDSIDNGLQGGTHPNGDETASNDGWAAFSGTSAAAPQLAGVAALIKQACSRLSPNSIRNIMMTTARDVTQGNCHPNTGANPATSGSDLATGNGLVDTYKAVMLAKVRCISIRPIRPPGRERLVPIDPVRGGIQPIDPIRGRHPEPIRGRQPEPIRGRQPEPIRGVDPIRPASNELEETSLENEAQAAGWIPISEEDLEALENMVINSDFDINDTE